MKKCVNILIAAAVAALAMVSCQKKEVAVDINENEVVESPIHFYATEIATKTTFGTPSGSSYPTLWTDSKNIKISYNKKASVEATVTPKNGGAEADFTPSGTFTSSGDSHIFYAMSPATAQVSNISTTYFSWKMNVPATQTPLDNSVDEGAQIIFAKYDAGATFPASVPFSFSHITAYGKLSFSGLALDGDEEIASITLTASKNWVGQYYYYVADHESDHEGDFKETSATKKITLNTNKLTDIWFACAPVDLSDGGTIDINVFTNKGVFVKKITFPAGKGNFQAGRIGAFTVDMSAVSKTAMVNSIADIKALYSSADVPFVANLTDALVTIVSGNNFYLQDASGAILGFTSGHGLNEGDKLNGTISGTVTKYQGNYEITGFDNSASKTTGNEVSPTIVAHATLVDNFANYESKYVKVAALTVSAVSGKDITVSDNANLKIRNESATEITVGTQLNAVGAACYYNSTKQVKVFTISDSDLIKIGSVINADDKTVAVGSTVSIDATTNSSATISYVSNDESIATVTSAGVITGVAVGSTTITCSIAAEGKYLATTKDITVTVTAGVVAADYSYTFAAKQFSTNGSVSLGGVSWTLSGTPNYYGYEDARGQQFGSKNNPATNAILTTSGISGVISTVTVSSAAYSSSATISVSVNGVSWGTKNLSSTNTEYEFTGTPTSGTVVITLTNPGSGGRALYIKQIEVN